MATFDIRKLPELFHQVLSHLKLSGITCPNFLPSRNINVAYCAKHVGDVRYGERLLFLQSCTKECREEIK
ncbi:hypothetical protein D3C86_1928520 [compost metagenome]